MSDVTGDALRRWREAQGWDVPRMAREIRKAAKDSGEDVAAHHGLVRMIPQWERGGRVPRERYRLLYMKIFQDAIGELSRGMGLGMDAAMRIAEVRARAAQLPGAEEIEALGASALAKPRATMTEAEIRALTAGTIARLHEVAGNLAQLAALLGADDAEEGEEGEKGDKGDEGKGDEGKP